MVRAKIVLGDFSVKNVLLHLGEIEGKKTALAKAEQMKAMIQSVSDGNDDIIKVFKECTQARRSGI